MKHRVIFSGLMSLILAFLMTAWVTWLNLGWSEQFFMQWMNAFIMAWPAAFVISFALGRKIQLISEKLVIITEYKSSQPKHIKNRS